MKKNKIIEIMLILLLIGFGIFTIIYLWNGDLYNYIYNYCNELIISIFLIITGIYILINNNSNNSNNNKLNYFNNCYINNIHYKNILILPVVYMFLIMGIVNIILNSEYLLFGIFISIISIYIIIKDLILKQKNK